MTGKGWEKGEESLMIEGCDDEGVSKERVTSVVEMLDCIICISKLFKLSKYNSIVDTVFPVILVAYQFYNMFYLQKLDVKRSTSDLWIWSEFLIFFL